MLKMKSVSFSGEYAGFYPGREYVFFTPLFNLFKKNYPLYIAKKINSPHIGPNMALTLSTVSYTFKYRAGKYLNPIKTGGQGESESRKRPC